MTLHLILNGSTGTGCSCLCGVVSIVNVGMPGAGSDDCILVQPYTFLLTLLQQGGLLMIGNEMALSVASLTGSCKSYATICYDLRSQL